MEYDIRPVLKRKSQSMSVAQEPLRLKAQNSSKRKVFNAIALNLRLKIPKQME